MKQTSQNPRQTARKRTTPASSRKKKAAPKKNNQQFSIGILFGLVIILLIIVIFLFNKETINSLVQKQITDTPPDETSGNLIVELEPISPSSEPIDIVIDGGNDSSQEWTPEDSSQEEGGFVVENGEDPQSLTAIPETAEESLPENESEHSRKARLFFIQVSDQGYIQLKSVIRSVPYTNAPLSSTLSALLTGPDTREMNRGMISLIPENTQLLSATINQGTLALNLNEAFRFNPMGMDGYAAQIQQIVYTATEFQNIRDVQFLIEGKVTDYLGAEGIYIGKPISRDDLMP